MAVGTHVQRIAARLDLTRQADPVKIEQDLMKIVPQEKWILFPHQVILHGRALCVAQPEVRRVRPESRYAKDKTA